VLLGVRRGWEKSDHGMSCLPAIYSVSCLNAIVSELSMSNKIKRDTTVNDNIVLIGFMGVGKGRTARALAAATGRFAIDTDDLIESFLKTKIRSFFAEQGEPAFRRVEQQVATWLEQGVNNTIISTGGGFYMVDNLSRLGRIIYLHSSVKGILTTIKQHPHGARKIKKRPLLQDFDKAKELFRTRLPLYRQTADYEIDVEGKKTSDVAAEIQALLGKKEL
jgi:shikimate kinase